MNKEGFGIFFTSLVINFLLGYFCYKTSNPIFLIVTIISILWTFFILYFFRDPPREIPAESNVIVSPADGRIVDIEVEDEPFFFKGKAVKISIFMSPFNVHINRAPVSGRVHYLKYFPGKFFSANKDKASLENEQMHIGFYCVSYMILLKQIAGFLARRIVCNLEINDVVERGQRFGMIKLGSRVDLFLPLESELKVNIGQTIYAGSTIIGKLKYGS